MSLEGGKMRNVLAMLVVLGLVLVPSPATVSANSFSDNFNRPDNTTVGNGWTAFGGGELLGCGCQVARE